MDWNFGGLDVQQRTPGEARFRVVPVPLEATVSYGKGTADGPRAIVAASAYMELFDEVHGCQPSDFGIHTLPPLSLAGETIEGRLHLISRCAGEEAASGCFSVFLGGEHALTAPVVDAYSRVFDNLSVLQIDAHADLRPEYDGTPHSHASVMRRVLEICPAAQVGIRSLSREEFQAVPDLPTTVVYAHELARDRVAALDRAMAALTDTVYLTFDVDGFDPSVLPATGTPEPGGLTWDDAMCILERLFASRQVVGADVVELAPMPGQPASDFTAAKLVYKLMALQVRFGRSRS